VEEISIVISKSFREFVESALVRLGYLFPDIEWSFDEGSSEIRAGIRGNENPNEIRKEILFQLYREKIYHDTLPIRNTLYKNT